MIRRIKKAAVIGSGVMGGGIAALCASAGIPTLLLDIVPPDLNDEEKSKPEARNRIVRAGFEATKKAVPAAYMDTARDIALVETGNLEDDFNRLKDCDIIIEVIVENLKIKQQLFSRLEKIRKKNTIIASNTSGLPLKDMSQGRTKDFKDNFLIMHFFNPPRYMKLLEVVKGEAKKEVYDFATQWAEKILGKGIVLAKDTPNFIGNRIGVAFIAQAFRLLESENIPVAEVDSMFGTVFGFPKTGIFALCDLVGLDIVGHLGQNSYNFLQKDEFRNIYKYPEFVMDMLSKKMFGNKTKDTGGFYKTSFDPGTGQKIKKVLDIHSMEHKAFDLNTAPGFVTQAKKLASLPEKQRMIIESSSFAAKLTAFLLVYSANRVPEISDTITGIDNAMKWGYAWEAGPFEIWDNIGIKKSLKIIEEAGFKVPSKITKMLESGNRTFYRIKNSKKQYYDFKSGSYKDVVTDKNCVFLADIKSSRKNIIKTSDSASLVDIGDGVFNIEYHSKMNAINKTMIDFIREAADYTADNGIGMVIGNQAGGAMGAFSAGGDLLYMLTLAKQKKYSEIDEFIKDAHNTIMGIKYAPFPVVAAPYGMTLGGGCETCLAAHRIVAHCELYMGLVEIGAGLIPSGAGMIHLWQRYVESIPTGTNIADWGAYFVPAFQTVAMAKVSNSAAEARNLGFLRPTDRIVFNKDYLIGEAKKEVLRMVEDGFRPALKKKIIVMGQAAQGMVWAELQDMKTGGFISPHMEFTAKKIAYCMSGGEAFQRQTVSEDYLLKLEREAFVELWETESTLKMAEHILKTGKPLLI
ncbi:MAG: 3-hydroxyacyl-CoA dehydrogenase/enoyl-CoA hydratase family protein [Spirochaetota bacterium]